MRDIHAGNSPVCPPSAGPMPNCLPHFRHWLPCRGLSSGQPNAGHPVSPRYRRALSVSCCSRRKDGSRGVVPWASLSLSSRPTYWPWLAAPEERLKEKVFYLIDISEATGAIHVGSSTSCENCTA